MYYFNKKKAENLMRNDKGFITIRCLPSISVNEFAHLAKAVHKSCPSGKVGFAMIGGEICIMLVP